MLLRFTRTTTYNLQGFASVRFSESSVRDQNRRDRAEGLAGIECFLPNGDVEFLEIAKDSRTAREVFDAVMSAWNDGVRVFDWPKATARFFKPLGSALPQWCPPIHVRDAEPRVCFGDPREGNFYSSFELRALMVTVEHIRDWSPRDFTAFLPVPPEQQGFKEDRRAVVAALNAALR